MCKVNYTFIVMNSKHLRLLFGIALIAGGVFIIVARPTAEDAAHNSNDLVEQTGVSQTQDSDTSQQETLEQNIDDTAQSEEAQDNSSTQLDTSQVDTEPESEPVEVIPTEPAASEPQEPEAPTPPPAQSGVYIDYSEAALASSQGANILFFHADWCIQCRILEMDIMDDPIPEGLTILEVDFDNSTELRQRYGVTLQTTLIRVDSQGNELGRFGGFSNPDAEALYGALL